MEKFLVIIPYLAREAQGLEISFAIAGWRKHFLAPHRIVVVGDYPTLLDNQECDFIPCPRIAPVEGQYLPHLDIIHKIDQALIRYPEYDGFIYTCDDIYAVNDFGPEEILFPKVQDAVMPVVADDEGNGWWKDLGKTRAECLSYGYGIRNWVCHLPVYYDTKKYLEILDRHDCRHKSFVVENLYFNAYYSSRVPLVLAKGNNLKYPVQGAFNRAEVEKAFKEKIWIYNSVNGWCDEFAEMLDAHFELCSTDYHTRGRSQR